ncbi:MAG: ABC transporter permease [Chloroflexi bacterium]|nr:ABC transporter permease [Chloroflexota bacterium]
MGTSLRKALIVARREYLQRVRTRSFAIMTVIVALLGFLIAMLPLGFRFLAGDTQTRIGIVSEVTDLPVDPITTLRVTLDTASAGPAGTITGRYTLSSVSDPAAARDQVVGGSLDGLLTIRRGSDGDLAFEYFSKASEDEPSVQILRQAAAALAIQDRLTRAGIDPASQAGLFAATGFLVSPVDPGATSPESANGVLGFALNILMFTAILTYGYWVATSVAEEKGSRVMELLVQAATPNQLLSGKVLGAGAAGLTQYAALVAGGIGGFLLQEPVSRLVLGSRATPSIADAASSEVNVSLPLLLSFGLYFVLGFTLYAGLYAAAGSLVGRVQDAQQVGTPITMLAMVGYVGTVGAAAAPDAPWVAVMSQIPFWSPSFMVFRIANGTVALGEVLLSIGLLLVGIMVVLLIAARIYRAGVLLYGQRPSLRGLISAARSG